MAEQGNILDPRPTPRPGQRGRVALLLVLAALAGAIAGLATDAFGQAPMLWHARPFMGGPFDPAQVDRHIGTAMGRDVQVTDAVPGRDEVPE